MLTCIQSLLMLAIIRKAVLAMSLFLPPDKPTEHIKVTSRLISQHYDWICADANAMPVCIFVRVYGFVSGGGWVCSCREQVWVAFSEM